MAIRLNGSFEDLNTTNPIDGFSTAVSDLQYSGSGDDTLYGNGGDTSLQGDDDFLHRSGVRHGLMVWSKSCRQAISQLFPFIDTPKLQPGECVQDSNGWWYTIHPKTSRLIYADSQAELQKMVQELASRPAVRRPSPWF